MATFTKYCGIDVSKDVLDYCLRTKESSQSYAQLSNSLDKIEGAFCDTAFDDTLFIVEYTGNYSSKVLHVLTALKRPVKAVSPYQSKSFMSALGQTNKNDKQAAKALSIMGEHLSLRTYKAPSKEMQQRKQILQTVRALESQVRAIENQLHALDQLVFVEATSREALCQVLKVLEDQLKPLREKLYDPVADPAYEDKLKYAMSVKGIGKKTANAILLVTNGLEDFEDAAKLSKFLGLTPHSHHSGSSVRKSGHITKFGSKDVRAMLYMCARSAIRFNDPCKDMYQRLRRKGKPHKVAAVAVMHKLVKQVFACVTNKTFFDNDFEKKLTKE